MSAYTTSTMNSQSHVPKIEPPSLTTGLVPSCHKTVMPTFKPSQLREMIRPELLTTPLNSHRLTPAAICTAPQFTMTTINPRPSKTEPVQVLHNILTAVQSIQSRSQSIKHDDEVIQPPTLNVPQADESDERSNTAMAASDNPNEKLIPLTGMQSNGKLFTRVSAKHYDQIVALCTWYYLNHYVVGSRNGHSIQLNRYVYELETGEAPPSNMFVDHEDGNPLNNTCINLRLATPHQNSGNTSIPTSNTSGAKCVSWHQQNRNWAVKVQTKAEGKFGVTGSYRTIDEAVAGARAGLNKIHGDRANCGINEGYLKISRYFDIQRTVNPDLKFMEFHEEQKRIRGLIPPPALFSQEVEDCREQWEIYQQSPQKDEFAQIFMSGKFAQHQEFFIVSAHHKKVMDELTWTYTLTGPQAFVVDKMMPPYVYIMTVLLNKHPQPTETVDHYNWVKLDNSESNLSYALKDQQKHNQRLALRNTSGYQGVRKTSAIRKDQWQAFIKNGALKVLLGKYYDIRFASYIWDTAADIVRATTHNTNYKMRKDPDALQFGTERLTIADLKAIIEELETPRMQVRLKQIPTLLDKVKQDRCDEKHKLKKREKSVSIDTTVISTVQSSSKRQRTQ